MRDPSTYQIKKKKASGAGCTAKAAGIQQASFSWFADVKESCRLFKLKANQLYEEWLRNNPTPRRRQIKA